MDPAERAEEKATSYEYEERRQKLEEEEMNLLDRLYAIHEERQQLDNRSYYEKTRSHKGGRKLGKDAARKKAMRDKYGNVVNPYVVSL